MSKYTAEIRTIVELGYDLFDWSINEFNQHDFHRTDASKALVSDEALIQGFIDHYYFREIGSETLERFKHFLKVQWNESLGEFDTLLTAYSKDLDPDNDYSNVVIQNDTPKNALDFGEQSKHASFIVSSKGRTKTQIEVLEQLHEKIKDIQTEFYESLDNLFMQLY